MKSHRFALAGLVVLGLPLSAGTGRAAEDVPLPAEESARASSPSLFQRYNRELLQRPPGIPSDAELEAQGARIGAITFDRRQVFDVGRSDPDSALFRLVNRLHIPTRQSTIDQQLLFKSGDPYRGRVIEETARLLRATRYLRDAQIRPVRYADGVVDLEVKTQDVWTLNPGISFGRSGGKNSSGIELEDFNFLGTGVQVGITAKSDVDRDERLLDYFNPQLGRTWWSLGALYSDNSDGQRAQFALVRPFYALDVRRAGGISFRDESRIDSRYDRGEVTDRFQTDRRTATAFFGHSGGLRDGWVTRYTWGFTIDDRRFGPAPGLAAPGFATRPRLQPADREFRYPWFGVSWLQDEFETARNRDLIERIEDFSLGWRIDAQLGFASTALGSSNEALLFRAGVSKGYEPVLDHTLLLEFATDGRWQDGRLAGTLMSATARYYLRQTTHRLLFFGLDVLAGYNLDADQQVLLGGDNGLRGYPLRYQAGEGRWLFTAEQRIFTNWYPFGLVNVGAAAFFNAGATWGRDPLGTQSLGILKDLGVGLRLGNSRSGIGNMLHIDLAMPLDRNDGIDSLQILVETKRRF